MRLINTHTLRIELFGDSDTPDQYVILSHTWGKDEISFSQFENGILNSKIQNFCALAKKDGFKYAWADTCCIDKTSSSELSEAINSMYKWYKAATICYAYLEDIPASNSATMSALESCRWFTRGWTLQELIAPSVVEFYAQDWTEIGTKTSLKSTISKITGISQNVLAGPGQPRHYNVAERMSWASGRCTTRKEDEAYSLLGIFNVHMPMLYGEGNNAFQRLQEEILKIEEDYSIFAWPLANDPSPTGSLLAQSPAAFSSTSGDYVFSVLENIPLETFRLQYVPGIDALPSPPTMTSRGVCITLPLCFAWAARNQYGEHFAAICEIPEREDVVTLLCISLMLEDPTTCTYSRVKPRDNENYNPIRRFTVQELDQFEYKTINIPQTSRLKFIPPNSQDFSLTIKLSSSAGHHIEISKVYRRVIVDIFTPDTIESVPLPLSSTSLFKSAVDPPGILILAVYPTSGVRGTICILFGHDNGTPWCGADTAGLDIQQEDTANNAMRQDSTTENPKRHVYHPRADRWKEALPQFQDADGRIPRLEVAMRRAASSNQDRGNAHMTFSLSISILTD